MKKYLLTLTLLILMSSTSFAFDGKRKGFVLGGGLDYGMDIRWKLDNGINDYEKGDGLGASFIIGYGPNEKNLIVFEANGAGFVSDTYQRKIMQGFNGISWYHYLHAEGSSIFSNLGFGFYDFSLEGYNRNESGVGFQFGLGYEFTRHWQAGFYYSLGKTTDRQLDFKHSQVHFSILAIAF